MLESRFQVHRYGAPCWQEVAASACLPGVTGGLKRGSFATRRRSFADVGRKDLSDFSGFLDHLEKHKPNDFGSGFSGVAVTILHKTTLVRVKHPEAGSLLF